MTNRRTGLARVGLSAIIAGLLLAIFGFTSPASAEISNEQSATCDSALEGAPDPDLGFATDPADGTEVAEGDEIEVTLTWGETVWDGIDKLAICMYVDDVLTEVHWEKPGVDDGTEVKSFTVPEGAEEVCVNGRISGEPGDGNTTDSTHKSDQACFPVGEGETETCPADTTWVDANQNEVVDEGECQPNEVLEPELAATIDCGVPTGMKVTITNTGDADGTVDVTSNDAVVHDEVLVPVGQSVDRIVDVAEDTAYDIEVVGVQAFTGTRDCVEVQGVVIPKTPAKPAPQVAGVQVQQLPRTGDEEVTLAMVGLGLIMIGAGALLVSRDHATI